MDDLKEKDDRHLKFESMDIRYRDPEFLGFEQQTMKLELRALHLSVAKLQEQVDSLRKMLAESTKQQNSQDASITQNPPTIQNSGEAEKPKDTQLSKESPNTEDAWIKVSHKKKPKKDTSESCITDSSL